MWSRVRKSCAPLRDIPNRSSRQGVVVHRRRLAPVHRTRSVCLHRVVERKGRSRRIARGDPAGFVLVLDERTLAIPDRLGNGRLDTFRNVLLNPHVALIFVIPGITYTLRATGEAIIVRDAELLARMAVNGKTPTQALVVSIASVFSHCPKCMIRAGLWNQEKWPDTTKLPSFAETLIAHAKLTEPLEEVAAMLETANRDRLY